MKKIFILLSIAILFSSFAKLHAQSCATCPPVFTLRDSIRCNSIDVVRGSTIPRYTNQTSVTACQGSQMTYSLTANPVCYPTISYSLVSITGGTMLSFINNQFTVLWGNSNVANIIIAFATPPGAGVQPCIDTMRLSFALTASPFAAFTASPQPACFTNPTNITFNSSGTTNAVNYFWDFGDGFTSTQVNPTHGYTAPGSYIVTLTVTNSGFFNGSPTCPACADSVQHTVVISSTPGPDITCVASVCAGDTGHYCTSSLGCSSYTWTITGGTIISGQNTPCINVLWGSGSPQGTINLVVTGCAAAACTIGTTINIPIIPVSGTISGPMTVCVNTSATYVLPSWPGTTYSWSISGGGAIAPYNTNTNQVTVSWTAAGSYFVNCSYFDSSLNCGGAASYPVNVLPKLNINGPATVCQSTSSNLTASAALIGPVPSTWTFSPAGPVINSGNGTPTVNVNWPNAGTYTVTATAVAPGIVCSNASYIVTVLPKPIITAINGPSPVCTGSTHVYSAVSNGNGPFSWTVTNGTFTTLGANSDSIQVIWGAAGPFSISVSQLSFPGNCASNTFTQPVAVYPAPLLTGPLNVCADNTETYMVTNIVSGNFQWYITPPSFGTIISGQGTNTVMIKWHGNNNPGNTNTVYLHYGLCNADSVAININEPTAAMITATGSLCVGAGVTLSTGATGTFTWTCTEHPIVPAPGNTPSITVNQFGHYHVQIQNYNGTGCTVTADYFIPNTGTPVAHISANNVLTYCLPSLPNLTLAANNLPGYTFQWFLGNTPVTGVGAFPTYNVNTLTMPGSYSYHVVVHLGTCTDTSNVITITIANCPPIPPGPCAGVAIDVTGITGCNPFTLTVAASAPAGAVVNTPPNPTITHYEDGSTVNSFTTHTYTTVGYQQVNICVDVLLPNSTICRVCRDTVINVTAAADFNYNIGCGIVNFFDASTTVFPAVISNYTWLINGNPGNTSVPPAVASYNNVNAANPVLTVSQSGSYIITEIIKVGSCSIIHKDTLNIHVPDADFNVMNSCVNTTVNFAGLFPEPVNYWSFGDAATSYTDPTFHAYAAASFYPVMHIVTDGNGCKDTVVKPIMIIPAPTCNISYAGPTTFCFGDSLFLNACAGFTNYQWYNNGVAITGATNPIDTATQSGNYYFTAISPAGCLLHSDTLSITVNQAPNAAIITSGSACAQSSFFADVQPCAGCFYQWTADGNPAGNASQLSGVVGSTPFTVGTHTIIIAVTNSLGCTSRDTLLQNFFPQPTVAVSVAPNPPQFCSNNVYTFTATTNAANPAWAWTFNALNPVLSVTNMLTASAAGSYTVSVTNTITGCMNSAVKLILPSPDLNLFPIGCDTLCDTSHVFLPVASFNNNLAGYIINWYDNAPAYVSVGSGPSFPLSSLLPGNHNLSVIVTAPNGCMDTSNVYSVVTFNCLSVVAVKQLELKVKQAGGYALLNWTTNRETDNDYFIAERSSDGIHFSFAGKVPSKGNSSSPQSYLLNDPILYFNQPVYYRVRSVDKNGAYFYSAIVKLVPVKVPAESMLALPTITRGATRLYVQSNSSVRTNLLLYATDGKQVMKIPVALMKGANNFEIDLGGLPAGLYLAAVATNEKQLTVTVVKK